MRGFLALILASGLMLAAPALRAARSFNGTSDYISIGNVSALNLNGSLTLAAWVYSAATPASGYEAVIGEWNDNTTGCPSGTYRSYVLTLSGTGTMNGMVPFIEAGGATYHVVSASPWNSAAAFTGKWVHVAEVWDSAASTLDLYIDGSLNASTTTSGSLNTGNCSVEIGNHTSNDAHWNGDIAEAGVWNVALTAGEISALAGGTPPSKIRAGNLAGYWPLYGAASPEPDLSGNRNNGTLTGTTAANHCPCGK